MVGGRKGKNVFLTGKYLIRLGVWIRVRENKCLVVITFDYFAIMFLVFDFCTPLLKTVAGIISHGQVLCPYIILL